MNAILSNATRDLVGFLYEWDKEDLQPAWFDGAVKGVRYEPMKREKVRESLDVQTSAQERRNPLNLEGD
ncbi:hypothetical protein [Ruegeria aquimaris]|uniref:Uncharacterized protein n=1 Tax=Ruegeria aquimaris TaxID=2984333 RepID=A0ABT3AJZ4_9RHOB|nr:hypothetical protein [Ruegeria sp. XHP0148]MCV2888978.1 hypothetical protein [Ruegeria sp. XHP0148]